MINLEDDWKFVGTPRSIYYSRGLNLSFTHKCTPLGMVHLVNEPRKISCLCNPKSTLNVTKEMFDLFPFINSL